VESYVKGTCVEYYCLDVERASNLKYKHQ
jgi:hypothetical protein